MDISLHQVEMEPLDPEPGVFLVDVTNLVSMGGELEGFLPVELETKEMEIDQQ